MKTLGAYSELAKAEIEAVTRRAAEEEAQLPTDEDGGEREDRPAAAYPVPADPEPELARYRALKPGGILGVVEHRANPYADTEAGVTPGYVTEAAVIAYAEAAGFERLGRSEVNANPLDTKDYPKGVWTLPPALRLGDEDREKYLAIGESDRMTLKFMKPAE